MLPQPMPPRNVINRIIDFSVRNRGAVFALIAALCVAGW